MDSRAVEQLARWPLSLVPVVRMIGPERGGSRLAFVWLRWALPFPRTGSVLQHSLSRLQVEPEAVEQRVADSKERQATISTIKGDGAPIECARYLSARR